MKAFRFLPATVCCMFFATPLRATGQAGEIIIIDKDTLQMLTLPIEKDSVLSKKLRTKISDTPNRTISSGCWRGYVGVWEIRDSVLYLNYMLDCTGKVTLNTDGVFDHYVKDGRIMALWFTGKIRVASGKEIYYQHGGFARYYEFETIYRIENGRIVDSTAYHNTRKDPSMSPQELARFLAEKFNIEQFPELENSRVRGIAYVVPTQEGKLDSIKYCRVTTKFTSPKSTDDPDRPYREAFIAALKHWGVLNVNGEIRGFWKSYIWQLNPVPQIPRTWELKWNAFGT